jgi:hypothetical protein
MPLQLAVKFPYSGLDRGFVCLWSRSSGCFQKGLPQKPCERSRMARPTVPAETGHITDIVADAAARLNLLQGRDRIWRGRCPACGYSKSTLEIALQDDRIAISCSACGAAGHIAAVMGIPQDLVVAPSVQLSKITRALGAWRKSAPATGTSRKLSAKSRNHMSASGVYSLLPRQQNWSDGGTYPTMLSLVQQVPGEDDSTLPNGASLVDTGVHFTFLEGGGLAGLVRKASSATSELTLGQLRHGGVWLTPIEQIGEQLAIAEGIETALSVMQITKLPTVAALSAAGMRSLRWPVQVSRLWIAADNDQAGLRAARVLLERALRAGLQAQIKIPTNGKNDFNDLLRVK